MNAPTASRAYTLAFVADLLVSEEMITEQQRDDVVRNEVAIRQRAARRKADDSGASRVERRDISPVEVLLCAGIETPKGDALREGRIMAALARCVELPYVKLDPLKLNEGLITGTMTRPFARKHVCLPVKRLPDGRIVFAVDNPFDLELQESLRRLTLGEGYVLHIADKTDILRIITDVYGFRKAVVAAEAKISSGMDIGNLEQLVNLSSVDDLEATDKYVVSAVEFLLRYAFDQRASDIHLEPKRDEGVVRLRIDGVLHSIYRMPMVVHNAMVSRLKTLARLDISERRRPQDGRIKTATAAGAETEMRVSSVPVAFGEKIVLRILDSGATGGDLESLGFFESDLLRWRELVARSHGLVLISGPTGSGKTSTLYATLRELASPLVNVTTVEDPIEIVDERFNQVLAQPKIGLSFGAALRNVLRQDPDIIMVGEIRDQETAAMAVQAALTGHLVLSTVHTNDAPSAIARLQDLGVPGFLIASTLAGVMAQRLVRRICEHCAVEDRLSTQQTAMLGVTTAAGDEGGLPVFYGEGCEHCRGTGFYGRTGVFEIMSAGAQIQELIQRTESADEIRRQAIEEGMVPLRDAGIRKLAMGVTSFDEILRVLGGRSG